MEKYSPPVPLLVSFRFGSFSLYFQSRRHHLIMEGIICKDSFFTWNQNMIKSKWTNLQYKLISLLLKYLQHQWEKMLK